MNGDFENPPIVLSQQRGQALVAVIFGISLLMGGIAVLDRHFWLDGVIPAEWVFFPGGFAFAAFGAINAVSPRKLILSPEGVVFHGLFSTRRLAWTDIGGVGLWTYRRRRSGPQITSVQVQPRSGAPLNLPTGWGVATPILARMIQECRRRWGGVAT
jgi:hypothetical protein